MENKTKHNLIKIILAVIICVMIALIPLAINLISKNIGDVEDDNSSPQINDQDDNVDDVTDIEVSVEIQCYNLFKEGREQYVEDVHRQMGDELFGKLGNGAILKEVEVKVPKDSKVIDVMRKVTENHNIPMVVLHNGGYISSIQGLGERMAGDNSGWRYDLNGGYAMGVNEVKVKKGDKILFWYTLSVSDTAGSNAI